MPTFLFDKIIFGPVSSRRLGNSLGINLLPPNKKICNFDCIYCECGLTDATKADLPTRREVALALENKLKLFAKESKTIDTITFAGNGEPTLHKDFHGIIEDTIGLRNTYFPKAKIALLTNSTTLASNKIQETLKKIELPILKLDSVHSETVELLNCPIGRFNIENVLDILQQMEKPVIQTMFVCGSYKGKKVDNTSAYEVDAWLEALKQIKPLLVMIYTIARDTPFDTLEKVPLAKLEAIAKRVNDAGFETQISG